MKNSYLIKNIEDFDHITEMIIKSGFNLPVLVCLIGDLGSGKTTFTKYLGSKLNITEDINSPTFIIHNEYKSKDNKLKLQHLDLYRLENNREFNELHIERHFSPQNIIVVEWADKFIDQLTKLVQENNLKMFELNFHHETEDSRLVILKEN